MTGTFRIELGGPAPSVELDGQRLTAVREVRVFQRHGEFAQVVCLFDASTVTIEGLGEVNLARESNGQDAQAFLAKVNPAQLEVATGEASDYETSPIATALEVLKGWASGDR